MDNQHADDHSAHIGPGAHLPDPSVWPIVVGLAALILGAAIIWWSRDGDSEFAGPLLGAALVAVLAAAGGWAYEDGRMKRKAESHGGSEPRNARYTQVITFAVADGKLEEARGHEGIISRIESTDADLRDLAGFQDLRIIASPATSGPSQVLVETTWSDRDGLATYDETRRTVLDMVAGLEEQVVPGSVQVFDMVVVRDTKDVSVRFGAAATATLIGSLAVGGLFVGAGLTLFAEEGGGGEESGEGGPPPASGFAQTGVIGARNIAFDSTDIALPPATEVTVTFENREGTAHNIRFFAGPDYGGATLTGCTAGCPSTEVSTAPIIGPGASTDFTFTTPAPGAYAFDCALHPDDMRGVLNVQDGARVPGAPPAAPPAQGEGTPAAGSPATTS